MSQAALLYPPITDTTSPYHSLVYLASFARRAGFTDITICDTNIEALNHCAQPAVLTGMVAAWRSRRRALASRRSLSGVEQHEYQQLLRAEAVDPARVTAAIDTLRDTSRFYEYGAYRAAAEHLSLWMESLSCSAFPGQFEPGGHSLRPSGWLNLSSVADLTNDQLLTRLVGPFLPYFEGELFPSLVAASPRVIGINVTYTSQLPYALWLVRRLRESCPEAFIVSGGTEVSAVWKYLRDRNHMIDLFEGADACVIGEGETAFVRLLEEVIERRPPAPIANVVRIDAKRRRLDPPPGIFYEQLDELPMPDYSLMDSSRYFSPHPLVYYSPTRGCYWNKCTFCDYGLNFGTPTSPWRQVPLERSVEDLRAISAHTRHVYLSVDVLAPGRLLQLASAIAAADIDIQWAAEIRLERFFDAERCQVLRRSGCVAVSVGFEAGAQRILDLIDKGTTLSDIEATIQHLAGSGIAVQMMGFTGFPTETIEEALASVEFLARNERWWTTSALGSFMLTPGAIVARKLASENAGSVRALRGDDIVRTLHLTPGPDAAESGDSREVRAAKQRLITADFDRPFAGGIDAAHSIFYYSRYGLSFPRELVAASSGTRGLHDDDGIEPNGSVVTNVPFDVLGAAARLGVADMGKQTRAKGHALTHDRFVAALEDAPAADRERQLRHFFVRTDGTLLPCPASIVRLIDAAMSGRNEFERVLDDELDADDRHEVEQYVVALRRLKSGAARPDSALGGSKGSGRIGRAILTALVDAGILRRASRHALAPARLVTGGEV